VANNNIEGKQCTILWHVDDLKISHVDKDVVEGILKKLNEKFRQESPLTTSRRKVLDYLGVKIDYQQKGKVKCVMYEYIDKMLEELPTDMSGLATTPASNIYSIQIQGVQIRGRKRAVVSSSCGKTVILM